MYMYVCMNPKGCICMDHKGFIYDSISKVCMYNPKGCLNPKDAVHY